MTVKELINILSRYDENRPVTIILDGEFRDPDITELNDEEYGIHCVALS